MNINIKYGDLVLIGGIVSSVSILGYVLYKYMDDILLYNHKRKQIKYIEDYVIIKVIGYNNIDKEVLLDTKLYNDKYYKEKNDISYIKVIYTFKGKQYKIIYTINGSNLNTIKFPPYEELKSQNAMKEDDKEKILIKRNKLIKNNSFLTALDDNGNDRSQELNQLMGPKGNFYRDLGLEMKVKHLGINELNCLISLSDGDLVEIRLEKNDILEYK
jgi:hypothetical protein